MENEPVPEDGNSDVVSVIEGLAQELTELYSFRDLFFENHPIEMASEKNKLIEEKMNVLAEKFNNIDEEEVPISHRARYLYMKGRIYNVNTKYDPRATQCLSKAVKLNPRLVDAWNELGECYWKNKNIQDAKSCFEGALKQERNLVALRCLSVALRQQSSLGARRSADCAQLIQRSQDLAKEAVERDPKDGQSWSVLGNAHLCRFFLVAQDPATLKAAMSAYKQAASDPVARGQPDLYYNCGVALKYNEQYQEALDSFERACRLDPTWEVPADERARLRSYVQQVAALLRTRGKLKGKRLAQMVQSIDASHAGRYSTTLLRTSLAELKEGENGDALVLGRVVGSVYGEGAVPFTFALVDGSGTCVSVTVYNWADGRGVIIGDSVAVPRPPLTSHSLTLDQKLLEFKSIRVNNPMLLLVNGKKIGRNQVAGTQLRSTYEIH